MPLEESLSACTAAVTRLANIMEAKAVGGAAAPAEGAKRSPGRPRKVTFEEVKAIAKKLMDEKGRPVAVKLIKKQDAEELAKIPESKYAAFIAEAEVLLAQQDAADEEDEAELGL